MLLEKSGPWLFLCYAWICVEEGRKVKEGEKISRITDDDFSRMKKCVECGIEPTSALLQRCYPKSVNDLRLFARNFQMDTWSYDTVAMFWREHHNHGSMRDVAKAMVCDLSDVSVQVISGSRTFFAYNIYGLQLEIGNMVYLHRDKIAEKVN